MDKYIKTEGVTAVCLRIPTHIIWYKLSRCEIFSTFSVKVETVFDTEKLHQTFIKGAVCKFLTLLKHKNTIICLQIFKKHAKLTYLFI